jgi:hypothetical protein
MKKFLMIVSLGTILLLCGCIHVVRADRYIQTKCDLCDTNMPLEVEDDDNNVGIHAITDFYVSTYEYPGTIMVLPAKEVKVCTTCYNEYCNEGVKGITDWRMLLGKNKELFEDWIKKIRRKNKILIIENKKKEIDILKKKIDKLTEEVE